MTDILIVAPHPDDESLGCGGAILKHIAQGDRVHWVIATEMNTSSGYSADQLAQRDQEIEKVAQAYPFSSVHRLGVSTAKLDAVPFNQLVEKVATVVRATEPTVLYLPHPIDAHSDHRILFEACCSCTKWFRHPSVRQVLVYETLSETDFGLNPGIEPFRPNVWVDISSYLDRKIEILGLYPTEFGQHPFPRSVANIRAQANVRGSQSGFEAAEAFMLLKDLRP